MRFCRRDNVVGRIFRDILLTMLRSGAFDFVLSDLLKRCRDWGPIHDLLRCPSHILF